MAAYTIHQPDRSIVSQSPSPVTTLVGANFTQYPYISAFGAMTRVCRLHVVPKAMLYRYLGLRFTRRDDIPMALATSEARKDQIALYTECDKMTREYWDLQSWMPFSTSLSDAELLTSLRICPCCSRTGYHTMLFHLPWVERCPWHGEKLIDCCPRCSRSLMDEVTSDALPLKCPCGSDLFDRRAACRGDPFIYRSSRTWQADYLDWAMDMQTKRYLISAIRLQSLPATNIGQLIDLPLHLRSKCQSGPSTSVQHQVQVLVPATSEPATQQAEDFLQAMDALPVAERAAINVPPALLRPFRAIAQNIVEKLPARTLFEGDLLRIYPPDDPHHHSRPPGTRHRQHVELTFLPVLPTATGGVLDCASIDKRIRSAARGAAGDLIELLMRDQGVSSIRELPPETQTVLATLGKRLLLHGYAQGIRIILSRYITEIYDLPRDRPKPRLPIAVVFLNGHHAVKAHLAWVKAPAV